MGEPRERIVTWYDPDALGVAGRSLTGFEFLKAMTEGRLPPPFVSLIGAGQV